jgi:CRISPR/Cas system-associated exonuclease Cas4 (RecB family)
MWLDAPPLTGQQDAHATVSGLQSFAQCPRRYFLGHYLGFDGHPRRGPKAAEEGSLPATDLGTQVHRLLAGETVADACDDALLMAESFRQSAFGRRAASAQRVEREFGFLLAVEGLVIRGQVDLWFEEGGELTIVDYKTDAVNQAEAHRRAPDYALQLRLYAMAVEQLAGRAANRACLHFLRSNVVVGIDLAPSLIDSPAEIVREFQRAQDSLQFPMREGAQCQRCPFFHGLCPAVGS